ncbi:MAG: hypothetical protein ACFFCW_15245 [Candidatus Hodarchaeota archaeon]
MKALGLSQVTTLEWVTLLNISMTNRQLTLSPLSDLPSPHAFAKWEPPIIRKIMGAWIYSSQWKYRFPSEPLTELREDDIPPSVVA